MELPMAVAPVAVGKRGKRTLVGLGLSLLLVACYWFTPNVHSRLWSRRPASPVYKDENWGRLEEVRLTHRCVLKNSSLTLPLRHPCTDIPTLSALTPETFTLPTYRSEVSSTSLRSLLHRRIKMHYWNFVRKTLQGTRTIG